MSALSIALIGAAGCASQNQPAAPSAAGLSAVAPASAPASPPPIQISTHYEFGGPEISIYHPDTRALYLWSGDPRPGPTHRPMTCVKVQMNDTPSGGPVTNEPCS